MTQSLIQQLTAKQEEISLIQQAIPLEQDLDKKIILSQQMDQLMRELLQIRTVYGSWQINEAKRLESEVRGL
jgi:uncharacterized protein YjgD (DUF1641 family)